jgi:hypothetical protein
MSERGNVVPRYDAVISIEDVPSTRQFTIRKAALPGSSSACG